jgi:hypothetical protein
LVKVIKFLNNAHIPYAIVGAFAASFYGMVRASFDADAVISAGENNEKLEQLVHALNKEGLLTALRKGDLNDPIRCVINIKDKFKNRVDLLIGVRGMKDDIFDRVMTASFQDTRIKIIGIEDFIAMKVFAGSAKDIHDVIGVIKVSMEKIKLPLLTQLTLHYGKRELKRLEQIIRNEQSLHETQSYIRHNPSRWATDRNNPKNL